MNIYLTGGTGFIGSYVVRELCGKSNRITVLARNPRKARGLAALPGVRVVKAPMQDMAAIAKVMKKPDALVHIALCWGDSGPEMMKNETLIPTLNLDNPEGDCSRIRSFSCMEKRQVNFLVKQSFALGGISAVLIIKRFV